MPKIVHICSDEKFIKLSYDQFEYLYPNQNQFYIYGSGDNVIKYIKLNPFVKYLEINQFFFESLNDSIVIFHSIPIFLTAYLKYINSSNKVVWFLFGFETYGDSILYSENLLLDKITLNHFKEKSKQFSFNDKLQHSIFPIIRKFKKNWRLSKKEYLQRKTKERLIQLKRVDYIGTSFEEERVLQSKILNFERPLFHFWYYPLELIIDPGTKINFNKNKILIGHSGYPNGNHLDVFYKIKSLDLDKKQIIVPLSYGDQEYINKITELNPLRLDNQQYITDFLKLKDYNILLNSVKIAIFNNRRQQAIGNIITLIYFGAKVFLSEKNTFYQYLKKIGIIVYSYEKDLNNASINNIHNHQEIEYNRNILYKELNKKTLQEQLKLSIENLHHV